MKHEAELQSCRPHGNRLKRLVEGLSALGSDHAANLHALTALCGDLLSASCALYNRLQGGLLCSLGQWSTPPGFIAQDAPRGHLCFDVIQRDTDEALLVRRLQASSYAQTDPNVKAYGLQTYLGQRVRAAGVAIGSLCVVYDRDVTPTEEDLEILALIAAVVGSEDQRAQDEAAVAKARHDADETLRKSRANLLLTLNNLPLIAWLKDREGRFLLVNQLFAAACGQAQPEDLVGKTDLDVWPRDLAERYRADDEQVIRSGQKRSLEESLEIDGQRRWYELYKAPLRNDRGEVTGTTGFARDITDRKEAESVQARQVEELRRWYAVTLGREKRIAELKREVNALAREGGRAAPYAEPLADPRAEPS